MNSSNRLRCVIYTRKSTEDGLEQDFNSLDAQREACEAYIRSQAAEGWVLHAARYDDGGYSGASMKRPALIRLIGDIERGQVDIIVVYKVDRLTRSLADFAKLIEILDEKSVSFVSVTQAFNTTSSMGRLTLNVLLSFAQFEREVTAERIRDKFKASKEKGMWMGGRPPLGYDIVDRHLIINKSEAQTVKHIFEQYLAHTSVLKLMRALKNQNIRSKRWVTQAGIESGGSHLTRGALYSLLQNPVYIGRVRHKDKVHDGLHEGIIDQDLWEKVQAQLQTNRIARSTKSNARSPSLLAGLLEDKTGARFSPRHSKRRGKRYRYYVAPTITLPAHEIETLVVGEVISFLRNQSAIAERLLNIDVADMEAILDGARLQAERLCINPTCNDLLPLLKKVIVQADQIEIRINIQGLHAAFTGNHNEQNASDYKGEETYIITRPIHLKRCGQGKRLILGRGTTKRADPSLVKAITRAHCWFDELKAGASFKDIAKRTSVDQRHIARTIRFAFLAPDITEAILTGNEPQDLTTERLLRLPALPVDWETQRQILGFV